MAGETSTTLATQVRDRIKAISRRKDVRVEYRKLGRALKKQWLLDYAIDEHKLPREVVDFYAEFDGFEFAWRSNGLLDDPRDRARGVIRMKKLDDLMWRERKGYEEMQLDNFYSGIGLMLIREHGIIRAGYLSREAKSIADIHWFESFSDMLQSVCRRGFLPFELDDPLVAAVQDRLATPCKLKHKLIVGARVYGEKVKTEGFGLDRRGTIAEIVTGTNGQPYARVEWDLGDVSWTRVRLLAGIAEDSYERVRTRDVREVPPDVIDPLLDQFSHNVGSCLYMDADPEKSVQCTCESTYWLSDLSRSTPLAGYAGWVQMQLDKLPDLSETSRSHVKAPLTGAFGGSEFSQFREGRDLRRFAQALVESVAVRWTRAPQTLAHKQVVALFDRLGFTGDTESMPHFIRTVDPERPPRLAAVPRFDRYWEKAKSLGLDGAPVYYTHD